MNAEPSPDETPADEKPADGRARLRDTLRQPGSRGQVVAAVLLAVLGFAAAVQVQTNNEDDTYVGARESELIELINSLSLASQRAENEIAQLEQTRNSLLNDTEARRTALERARQQAEEYGILAGTLPAVGPGVRVTVEDPTGAVGTDNLLNAIQELRDAGAEAIEVNDTVRVVAQTSLKDLDEGGVEVDGEQVAAPYVIEAIGSPHTMASGLDIFRGFVDEVEERNGKVNIKEVDSIEIASVREPSAADYAETVPSE